MGRRLLALAALSAALLGALGARVRPEGPGDDEGVVAEGRSVGRLPTQDQLQTVDDGGGAVPAPMPPPVVSAEPAGGSVGVDPRSDWMAWMSRARADTRRFTASRRKRQAEGLFCQDDAPLTSRALRLLVFDFDETLTVRTYMPAAQPFREDITWTSEKATTFSLDELLNISFELRAVAAKRGAPPPATSLEHGERLKRLKRTLDRVSTAEDGGPPRQLAVLTKNRAGGVAVINLLKLAGLDGYFSAVWNPRSTQLNRICVVQGFVRLGKEWRPLQPRLVPNMSKANILKQVVDHPQSWFAPGDARTLRGLQQEEVALVDDLEVNFRGYGAVADLTRFCEVARFALDDGKPAGGIGARHLEDFTTLESFVRYLDEKASYPIFYGLLALFAYLW